MELFRRHRVDLNLIHDYCPSAFRRDLSEFLAQILRKRVRGTSIVREREVLTICSPPLFSTLFRTLSGVGGGHTKSFLVIVEVRQRRERKEGRKEEGVKGDSNIM